MKYFIHSLKEIQTFAGGFKYCQSNKSKQFQVSFQINDIK